MSKLDFANLVSDQINRLDLNRSKLANQAGISRQTLYKIINAEIEEAKLSTLVKLSNALQLHPVDALRIYFDAGEFRSRNRDDSGFVGDITYPDNSIVYVNQIFTKTWAVRNTGNTVWKRRKLICVDKQLEVRVKDSDFHAFSSPGLTPVTAEVKVPEVLPGETVELSVAFKAPPYPCTTVSYWKSIDEKGDLIFPDKEGLSCLVNVVAF